MKKIPLGTTDITLSRMGLGTWAIGGGPAWNGDLDRQICIDTILEAHRCGINLIDTAPGYNFGNSEVIVGNDSNLLIVFYVQIMPDDFVMQLHR
ncbi:aldo/keto reductase, partial [Escherichia coli]|nr:aldo/keto reductase [Escherichia coli]